MPLSAKLVSMSVSFRFPVQFKQVSTGKWWSELTTATDTILLPSVEPYNYYINKRKEKWN